MADMNFFQGDLVKLAVEEPKVMADLLYRWSGDGEYWRLLTSDIYRRYSLKKTVEWVEKGLDEDWPAEHNFAIRLLSEDRIIGMIGLSEFSWTNGEAWVGIGIGEPSDWGKGYGTDAMRILLRYAFQELNLHRVSLDVFQYNPRGLGSYLKAGFQVEGKARLYLLRDGQRWDLIHLGVLREEWERTAARGNENDDTRT